MEVFESPKYRVILIKSDTKNILYAVKLENGKSVSCTCPGFESHGRCKHLMRAEVYDDWVESKRLIISMIGEKSFNARYLATIKKYKNDPSCTENPKNAAIKRIIEFAIGTKREKIESYVLNEIRKLNSGFSVIRMKKPFMEKMPLFNNTEKLNNNP
jgi:hypothetical protein